MLAWWPALLAVLFWVGAPLLSLYGASVGVRALAHNVGHHNVGTPGTFVVTASDCEQQVCVTTGTFTSTDKRLVAANVIGDYQWQFGVKYAVDYNTDTGDVASIREPWDPTSTVVGLAGAVVFLSVWSYLLARALHERSARARSDSPDVTSVAQPSLS